MARCCSSPPPRLTDPGTEPSSGSKTPLKILPMRVSRATPTLGSDPPTLGTAWHSAQLFPLNTGPKPSSAFSTSLNSSRPSLKSFSCAPVRPGSGLVKCSESAALSGCELIRHCANIRTNTAVATNNTTVLLRTLRGTGSPSQPKLAFSQNWRFESRVNEVSSGSRKGRCWSEQAAAEQTESRRAPTRTGELGPRNHPATLQTAL